MKNNTLATVALAALLSGCSTLLPNTVRPEFEHMSHASQHFGQHTKYGANMANLVLHWDAPHHVSVEIAEGIDLDRHWACDNSDGEIVGPREEFSARVGYSFQVRP